MARHPDRVRLARVVAWLAMLAGVTGGCATNPAPKDWLPGAAEAARTAYGGWIELDVRQPPDSGSNVRTERIEGEFLSVGPDTALRILTADSVRVVFPSSVRQARLCAYDVQSTVGASTAMGALATLSNGWYFVFTAPVWIIGGALATGPAWSPAKSSVPGHTWPELSGYARFPQGWPEGLDPATVQPDERWPEVARRAREAAGKASP